MTCYGPRRERVMTGYGPRRERAMTNADPSPSLTPAPVFDSRFSRWVTLVLGVLVAVLLAFALAVEEHGRSDDALAELARLDDSDLASVAGAVRAAYGVRTLPADRSIDERDLDLIQPGWAKDRLLAKLAEKTGDAALARRASEDALRRTEHWRPRLRILAFAFLAPCAIAIAILVAWLARGRPSA